MKTRKGYLQLCYATDMDNYTYLYLFNPPNNSPLSTAVVDSAMQPLQSYQPSASESASSGSAAKRVWHTCMVDS